MAAKISLFRPSAEILQLFLFVCLLLQNEVRRFRVTDKNGAVELLIILRSASYSKLKLSKHTHS